MNDHLEPKNDPLRALLREARPAPPLPPRFHESVWRRIESAEAPALQPSSPWAWLEQWVERLLQPRLAVASLAVLLVAGGLTGFVTSASAAKQQAQERYLSVVAPSTLH